MIGQYLSNTNEKATVSILQNILELNKAREGGRRGRVPPATGYLFALCVVDDRWVSRRHAFFFRKPGLYFTCILGSVFVRCYGISNILY